MLSILIDSLTPRERKLQEAKFELITSEASYFKSLTVLEKHFINSHSMNDDTILSKKDQKILFGNVNPGEYIIVYLLNIKMVAGFNKFFLV